MDEGLSGRCGEMHNRFGVGICSSKIAIAEMFTVGQEMDLSHILYWRIRLLPLTHNLLTRASRLL